LFDAISGGYTRIVSIAKAKVGFIEPMHALAVTVAARVFITLDEQQAHGQCR
jgi:hypothetical protein